MLSKTPAQLIIGNHDAAVECALRSLYALFCLQSGCGLCRTCMHIKMQQHHGVTWLMPEKSYTRETLEPLFSRIAFVQGAQENHVFVLQKADLLSPAAANSLLKSLEEPPQGYHFFLLAAHEQQLLPTIRSRCITTYVHASVDITYEHPLIALFTTLPLALPGQFLKVLDACAVSEIETAQLLEHILLFWQKRYAHALQHGSIKEAACAREYAYLVSALLKDPIPAGSSKLWWKELYLRCRCVQFN
jgi:hypothetical protein